MNHGFKTSVCLLAGLALAGTGICAGMNSEGAGGNPYNAIVVRNIFDLKPPQTAKPPPLQAVAPPANVKLTGIISVAGTKKACFVVQEGALPGKLPGKPKYVTLDEGERQGGLELVAIDAENELVRVVSDGSPSEIHLEKAKSSGGAAGLAGGPMGGGSLFPGAMPMPGGAPGNRGMVRPAPAYAAPVQPAQQAYAQQAASAQAGGLQFGGDPSSVARPIRSDPQITPEEQIVLMEIERERTKDAVKAGELAPLPTTELTPVDPAAQ